METGSLAVPIRPMGVGDVLDTGIGLGRRNFRRLAVIAAWTVIPIYILSELLRLELSRALAGSMVYFGTSFTDIALTIACGYLIESGDSIALQAGSLYRAALKRMPPAMVLSFAVLIVGLLLILVPLGIYVGVLWAVSWSILILEQVSPIGAFRRSRSLTRGSWWHTFAVFVSATVLSLLLQVIVTGAFALLGGAMVTMGLPLLGDVVAMLGDALASIVLLPFNTAITVVLYYELRARSEGYDLQMRARSLSKP